MNACENTDNEKIKPSPDLTKDRKVFKNENAFFDAVMLQSSEKHEHLPVRKQEQTMDSVLQEVPSELLSLLNQDHVFQLDNWIIHLDFYDRKVLVIDEKDEPVLYADMISGKSTEGILRYNMEEDVFFLLENHLERKLTISEGEEEALGIFCGGGVSGGSTSSGKLFMGPVPFFPLFSYSMESVSQYKKFGVWFEFASQVYLHIEPKLKDPVTTYSPLINRNVVWSYHQNCRNGKKATGVEGGQVFPGWETTVEWHETKQQLRRKTTVYNNTRGLKELSMTSSYTFKGITALAPVFQKN